MRFHARKLDYIAEHGDAAVRFYSFLLEKVEKRDFVQIGQRTKYRLFEKQVFFIMVVSHIKYSISSCNLRSLYPSLEN